MFMRENPLTKTFSLPNTTFHNNLKRKMRGNFILLCFLVIISLHFLSRNSYALAPALYVFGDSLVDSGNNNLLPTLAKANFRPYGSNFAGGPTGRFTNGRTVADFIAEYLGLPLPPPYLSLREAIVPTGLNYASASCGILPLTGSNLGKCLSLNDQINLFQGTVGLKLAPYFVNSPDLQFYLSKSIFVVNIGSNDYILNYLLPTIYGTSTIYTPQSFAKLLVDILSLQLQRLYDLGARKIIVFEIGPIGCIPAMTSLYKPNGKCAENINKLAVLFNHQLRAKLEAMNSNLHTPTFIFGHIINLAYDAFINPNRYGLTDSSNACCTTWANGTTTCVPGLLSCPNPYRHAMWDGVHLTEAAYSIIARQCINSSNVCIPMNIKELVQA